MRAGLRRHLVKIQYKGISSQNTYGEEDVTWVDDSETWASIFPLRGTEYFANQQVQGAVTHKINIRFQTLHDGTRIGPNCRIVLPASPSDRIFNVQSALDPEERGRTLDIMAVEEV